MAENISIGFPKNESINDVLQRIEKLLNTYVAKGRSSTEKNERKNIILSSLNTVMDNIESPSKCRPGMVWDPISGTCKPTNKNE